MLLALALATTVALTPQQSRRIDAIVQVVMNADGIPGMSLAVERNGALLALRGYGTRNRSAAQAPDGYTIYAIGSLTKTFAAAAILRAVDRGALSLDQQVSTSLPPDTPARAGITIRELLAQTAGVPSFSERDGIAEANRATLYDPLHFTSGTQWEYSNGNYRLLGMVLQAVYGGDPLTSAISKPLSLPSTGLGFPPAGVNRAMGYRDADGSFAEAPLTREHVDTLDAAGGLTSNARDVALFLDKLSGGQAISHAAFSEMTGTVTLPDGRPTGYGLGFFLTRWYGLRVAEHSGTVDGYSADAAIVLPDRTAIVLLANRGPIDLVPLMQSVVAIVESKSDDPAVRW